MTFTCFRCTNVHVASDDGSSLFLDAIFLKNLKDIEDNEIQKGTDHYMIKNDEGLFQKWVQQKRNEYGEAQKAHKDLYMSLFLCKECFGFHNLDIILLGKKYSALYNLIQHVQLTDLERLQIQEVCKPMQSILKSLLSNIDIMFFFLYLQEEKYIENKVENYSLEQFNKCFERIKTKIVLRMNDIPSTIKKSIHRVFVFLVLHFFFQIYSPIFAKIKVEDVGKKFLCKTYGECNLILSVEIKGNTEKTKNENKINHIRALNGKNRKKQKIISTEENTEQPEKGIKKVDLYVSLHHLCICGHYNKMNKEISQTKWLIDSKNHSVLSVEECIQNIFKRVFYFSSSVFMGAGREDKDVRMMGLGRPFVFILKETQFSLLYFYLFFHKLKYITESTLNDTTILFSKNLSTLFPNSISSFPSCLLFLDTDTLKEETKTLSDRLYEDSSSDLLILSDQGNSVVVFGTEKNEITIKESKDNLFGKRKIENIELSFSYNKEIEELIDKTTEENTDPNHNDKRMNQAEGLNYSDITHINDFIEVNMKDLVLATDYSLTKIIMKCGEGRKKSYKCLIYHSKPMNEKEIKQINEDIKNYQKNESCILTIFQKTPLRVLHRRGLINRQRLIYKLDLAYIHTHFCLLYLTTQSGMYIKEFVNGDRGRTFPNLKFFFKDKFLNILNLDVSTIEHD